MINHTIHLIIDLIVPKPQYGETLFYKMRITNFVPRFGFSLTMLRAVDLNNQLKIKFRKIENITVGWSLTTEVPASGVEMFELYPKLHFLMRHVFAQVAGFGN
jgi:hypothetical protein